jgi:hypothetical protein
MNGTATVCVRNRFTRNALKQYCFHPIVPHAAPSRDLTDGAKTNFTETWVVQIPVI